MNPHWTDSFSEPASVKMLLHILETTPAEELRDLARGTPIDDDIDEEEERRSIAMDDKWKEDR